MNMSSLFILEISKFDVNEFIDVPAGFSVGNFDDV
jgi:hypothetical protein